MMAWGTTLEEMLRWQIDRTKKWLEESRKGIAESEELFKLPQAKGKPIAGTPESWSDTHGKLTPQEISLRSAEKSFRFAAGLLDRAEEALVAGEFATAVNLMVQARDHVWSTLAHWRSSHSVKVWRYVGKSRQAQAVKAQGNRATISLDDEKFSMTGLANGLAEKTDGLGDPLPAKELWVELLGLLDKKGAEPKEIYDEKDCCAVVRFISRYDGATPIYDSYKFTSFSQTISRLRNKKN